jgi:SET domain-containing protein
LGVEAADGTNDNNNNSGNTKNNSKKKKKKTPLDLANAQFDWLRSKGGGVDRDKVVISADSNHVGLGLFAADNISKGDLLMQIPFSAILKIGA